MLLVPQGFPDVWDLWGSWIHSSVFLKAEAGPMLKAEGRCLLPELIHAGLCPRERAERKYSFSLLKRKTFRKGVVKRSRVGLHYRL